MYLVRILRPSNPIALLSLVILILLTSYLISRVEQYPPEIPLWYSRVWGPERLANPFWLWLIPTLMVLVLTVNHIISKMLKSTSLIRIITWSSVIFGVILSYSLIKILLLVS